MRKCTLLFFVMALIAIISSFAVPLLALTPGGDFVVARIGYVPYTNVEFGHGAVGTESGRSWNPDITLYDFKSVGPALNVEYTMNAMPVLFSFGIEYRRLKTELYQSEADSVKLKVYNSNVQFLVPMILAKYMIPSGVYVGIGLSAHWMINADKLTDNSEISSKIDYWTVVLAGYMMKLHENLFLDVQGKFGYNLTNAQYSEAKKKDHYYFMNVKSSYDAAFYVGVGHSL